MWGRQAKPLGTRQLAGLILKNMFYARSDSLAAQKRSRWTQLDDVAKAQTRTLLLSALPAQVQQVPRRRACGGESVSRQGGGCHRTQSN